MDGERRKDEVQNTICKEVCKFLRYARPEGDLVWNDLLDPAKVSDYIGYLEQSGACGPSGQLSKLDRLVHGKCYLKYKVPTAKITCLHKVNWDGRLDCTLEGHHLTSEEAVRAHEGSHQERGKPH